MISESNKKLLDAIKLVKESYGSLYWLCFEFK